MRYPVCKHKSHARRESFVGTRVITRDHECLRVFTCVGRVVRSRICRIFWDFQDGGGPADAGGLVRALDESLRAFTSVGRVVWSRICRIYWDFQDGGGPADAGGLGRALDERLRVFTCVGRIVWSRICRIYWDFQDGEDLLTQVGSDERWTRVCERLREIMSVCECLDALTRDWYGWSLWVDHEMGRISCIQTDAGCFEQSTKCSSVGVRWSGL